MSSTSRDAVAFKMGLVECRQVLACEHSGNRFDDHPDGGQPLNQNASLQL
jgi:hypothetical protein